MVNLAKSIEMDAVLDEIDSWLHPHIKEIKEALKEVDWDKLGEASPERQFLESTKANIERYETQLKREQLNDR